MEVKTEKKKDSISFHFASNERIGARYENASRRRNLVGKHFEESQIRLSYGQLPAWLKRERERERKKGRASSYPPFFFLPVFLSLSGSNRRSTTIGGNLRKALALQASETIVSFRRWAGFMEVAAWNFATRPGKAVFHREISLFIGRIESIGCSVILSNRFHAQPPRYFPRVFENLWSRRSRSIFILSSFFSFFSSIFITNIPSCLYIFVFASVLKMGQAEKRRTKRRKLLRLYKRGARQKRRKLFSPKKGSSAV